VCFVVQDLPLVGIIEFFMYCTMQYFYERSKAADAVARNTQMVYCTRMIEYLEKAQGKGLHSSQGQSAALLPVC
jgi:hypothetical protein